MKISIASRSGKIILKDLELKLDAKVDEVAFAITSKVPKYTIHRQRLTIPSKEGKPIALEHGKLLSSYGIKDGQTINFKDLGPQIGWKTVFLIEYFGPILIHLFFYMRPGM
jgi:very-long-chain enoyl-CoA reductase